MIAASSLAARHCENKTIVECRPCPSCTTQYDYLHVFNLRQNLVNIYAIMPVAFYRRLGIHMTRHTVIK